MRIAALYDIHGNLPALEAVLAELDPVDLVVVGGDVVWGPWPRETIDTLLRLPSVEFIMGNADRAFFEPAEDNWKESNDWCAERLTPDHLAFLRSRPPTMIEASTVVCGHTHAQFARRVGRWRDPGSVVNPFGQCGAYWAVGDLQVGLRFTA